MNIGAPLEIDAEVVAESDAKYTDLYAYLEKIRQHSPISFIRLGGLPFSMRKTSLKILFKPETSRTREISIAVGFSKYQSLIEYAPRFRLQSHLDYLKDLKISTFSKIDDSLGTFNIYLYNFLPFLTAYLSLVNKYMKRIN